MPAGSDPVTLPHTWRPLGVRLASLVFGGGLLVVCAMAWIGFDEEIRERFTFPQKLTLLVMGALVVGALLALSRSKVVAETERIVVVNGYRRRVFARHQVVTVSMSRGAPWATLDLSDGTSVAAMGIQGSDGDRAREAVRQLRTVLDA
jgi:Bacterial PH domain